MEKLKQSEEEILKLGKKLISELELVYTTNTLARWLGHYVAELIQTIKNCDDNDEKIKLQKECCNLILEIWDKRERIPFDKPLSKLEPIINVLELLKKREHPFISHGFTSNNRDFNNEHSNWINFSRIVKSNSEKIYRKVLTSMIDSEVLEKDKKWIKEHGSFLSEDEKNIIEYLDSINEITISFRDGSEGDIPEKEKMKNLFKDLEEQIEEQKEYLLKLKNEILKKYDDGKR
jgi:hypothetical protein